MRTVKSVNIETVDIKKLLALTVNLKNIRIL